MASELHSFHLDLVVKQEMFIKFTFKLFIQVLYCIYCFVLINDVCLRCGYRLLQSSHAGSEDRSGGVRGAGEGKNPASMADHGGP